MTSSFAFARRPPRATVALAAAAAALLAAAPGLERAAGADEAGDGPVSGFIAEAVAEYDAGHFEEARALFRKAQAAAPSARTLRGIGMASFELRDYIEAVRALSASQREQRHTLSAEQRAHVDGLLARAEGFVGRFTPRLQPPDAALLVDGRPAAREPDGALLLPLGQHTVSARCPTCAPAERQLEVLGGERQAFELALAPAAAGGGGGEAGGGASLAGPSGGAGGAGRDEPTTAGAGRNPAAYVLGAVAVASAVGAVGSGLWWRDRTSELDACRAAGDRCRNESEVSGQSNVAAAFTLGLTATALTTGIIAAVMWSHHEPAPATHALACGAIKGGVTCAIRF